jgi:hypothetical protein
MNLRRVVTGHDAAGKAVFVADGAPPVAHDFASIPGFFEALLWATPPQPMAASADPTPRVTTLHPEPGGTRLVIVSFPPDAVMAAPGFDPEAAAREHLRHTPGIAERMEPDNPGMHRTETVDYVLVLEGEVWLELDDGEQRLLKRHDVVIQNATRHAWRNKSKANATILAVLIGATPRR